MKVRPHVQMMYVLNGGRLEVACAVVMGDLTPRGWPECPALVVNGYDVRAQLRDTAPSE